MGPTGVRATTQKAPPRRTRPTQARRHCRERGLEGRGDSDSHPNAPPDTALYNMAKSKTLPHAPLARLLTVTSLPWGLVMSKAPNVGDPCACQLTIRNMPRAHPTRREPPLLPSSPWLNPNMSPSNFSGADVLTGQSHSTGRAFTGAPICSR